MNSAETIPVTIIGGFLGSGKTTLLNRIMQADTGLRIAVMVNDFGQINIDSELVVSNDGMVMSLVNGCICCNISGDLIGQMESLLQRDQIPEYVIIEASGVSDPGRIARILNYPVFRGRIKLDAILVLIDAGQILNLNKEFNHLAMTQLEIADITIINKTDQCSDEELETIKHDWLFPDSRVYEATYADVPLPLIFAIDAYDGAASVMGSQADTDKHHHNHTHKHDDLFESVSWQANQPLKLAELRAFIEALPTEIFRAKGIFYTEELPGTPLLLQQVGARIEWTKASPDTCNHGSSLVLIGRKGSFNGDEIIDRLNQHLLPQRVIN